MAREWDVVKIERGLTAKRFIEWRHYADLEPFGEWRADYRAGLICALIANVNRDPKKTPKPFSAADFMQQWDKEPVKPRKPQSLEEQKNLLTILAYMHANEGH